jgi:thymidylate synthase (FAD)
VKVTLIDLTENPEDKIAEFAAICYDADKGEQANARRVKSLMRQRHLATLRFASATFKVEGVSRVCSHQLVRHPHLSVLQRSQRYTKEGNQGFITPPAILSNPMLSLQWGYLRYQAQQAYEEAIQAGIRKEDARFILPQGTTTELYLSGNLQAWFDFLKRRLDPHAQWEIRAVANRMYDFLHDKSPNVFNEETLGLKYFP